MQPGGFLLWKAVDQHGRKKEGISGPLLFPDRPVPLSCQLKMETVGERGMGRPGREDWDVSARGPRDSACLLARGVWLAIYLASHHPGC